LTGSPFGRVLVSIVKSSRDNTWMGYH